MAPIREETLDPADWDELRALGHRMVDDMMDYLEGVRDRPVWRPMPAETTRGARRADAPRAHRCRRGLPPVPRARPSLSQRQHPPPVLGLGDGHRNAARDARRHAGLGDESAPGRLRPVARAGRAAGDPLDGGAARLPGREQRPAGERRHRGQPAGSGGGAERAGRVRPARRGAAAAERAAPRWSTARARRTAGRRRRASCWAWGTARSGAFRWTTSTGWMSRRSAPRSRRTAPPATGRSA